MADNKDVIQDIYNLIIHEISIIGKNGETYKIFPDATNLLYESMSIVEGMFEASVVGSLRIRDLNSTAEQLHASLYDEVIIKLENPLILNSYKSLRFKIYNVRATEDQITNNLVIEESNVTKVKLEIQFISYEHYLLNYKEFSELVSGVAGNDIIAPISTSSSFASAAARVLSETNITASFLLGKKYTGLVNLIEQKYFKTGKDFSTTQKRMYIEESQNWVWYKQNQSMYPWSKLNRPIKASQLMQYLAEYAVSSSNPYACNFLFWQDLDRWNFRSVESLIKEPVQKEYFASIFPTKTGNIYHLNIVQESNFLRLLESNALSAKYYLVEPKWDQPYREYLDYNESHSISEVTYDYFRDYDKWLKVEKHPLIPSDIDTKPTTSNVVSDAVSGYFAPSYNNRSKTVPWEHHGYTFSNRDGFVTWQPMFDQVDLDGQICLLIQKEIKEKIKEKKEEYARKKNLKEKWKVYKCSICCDTRSVETEGELVFSPEYGISAVGAFSDLVNYNDDDGFTGERILPVGLTLSYDLDKEPFNKTIGQLMYLRDVPDIQTKYLYDLEVERINLAKEILNNSIQYFQNAKTINEAYPICDENYNNLCAELDNIYSSNCFCSQDKKDEFIFNNCDEPIRNRQEILNSGYFEKMVEVILQEKDNFNKIYEEYQKRKAFFISNDIGFTAENSSKNLFNVRSIKRLPIRGSKYEKLAHKTVLKQAYQGLSGFNFSFKGFSAGTTSYYPYEIFYNNDNTISPKIKHPYYDSGYNFDLGYAANPFFSRFDENRIGGPDSNSPANNDPYQAFIYYNSVQYKVTTRISTSAHILSGSYNNPTCEPSNSSSETFLVNNKAFTDSNPQNLSRQNILKKLIDSYETNFDFEYFGDVDVEIIKTDSELTIIFKNKTPNCNGTFNTTTRNYKFEILKVYSNNRNNQYLSAIDSGVCVLSPLGLERIQDFNPIDYINSRNFTNITEPNENDLEPKKPIENILEEVQSYVRIEFERPIGQNTIYDFPKGFYDTPGSEYYLPYHVFVTAGPFGTKSVDYNISVLGQDPYGFDVAVKRIKKKKAKLKPNRKGLLNDKDYHVNISGYVKPFGSDYGSLTNDSFTNRPYSYGFTPAINPYDARLTVPSVSSNFYNNNEYLTYSSVYGYYNNWVYNDNVVNKVYDDTVKTRESLNNSMKMDSFGRSSSLNEIFYHDIIKRVTRMNPLALPDSYFEINNVRVPSVMTSFNEFITGFNLNTHPSDHFLTTDPPPSSAIKTEDNYKSLRQLLLPGNVFGYFMKRDPTEINKPIPVDENYFEGSVSYEPNEQKKTAWLSVFELKLSNRNNREQNLPENETAFYGTYYGSCIWTHPKLQQENLDLSCIWKNDMSGESEYGLIGPELDDEDITFDRNFSAQFMVLSRQSIEFNPCGEYRCANPNPVDNSGCPEDDPLCNCPCQELRPDNINVGISGPEPTYLELRQLEEEMKECDLIESVLGDEWLGCDWSNPSSAINCTCPCIGEKFLEYLKYSQTYCTFWQTPKERPLLRNAQLMQLMSNKITIKVNGDLTIRPGHKVYLNLANKRFSGIWLVSTVIHDIAKTRHLMELTLIRDTEHLDPNVRAKELTLNTE